MRYTIIDITTGESVCAGVPATAAFLAVLGAAGREWAVQRATPAMGSLWGLYVRRGDDMYKLSPVLHLDAADFHDAIGRLAEQVMAPLPGRLSWTLDWLDSRYFAVGAPPAVVVAFSDPDETQRMGVNVPTVTDVWGYGRSDDTVGAAGMFNEAGYDVGELVFHEAAPVSQEAWDRVGDTIGASIETLSIGQAIEAGSVTDVPLVEDDGTYDPPEFAGPWVVTVVMADKALGGQEEGGWWYETYNPLDPDAMEMALEHKADRIFWSERAAQKYAAELDVQCRRWNVEQKRRSKDSVLSRGVYEAHVFEGWPRFEPAERPRYE